MTHHLAQTVAMFKIIFALLGLAAVGSAQTITTRQSTTSIRISNLISPAVSVSTCGGVLTCGEPRKSTYQWTFTEFPTGVDQVRRRHSENGMRAQ